MQTCRTWSEARAVRVPPSEPSPRRIRPGHRPPEACPHERPAACRATFPSADPSNHRRRSLSWLPCGASRFLNAKMGNHALNVDERCRCRRRNIRYDDGRERTDAVSVARPSDSPMRLAHWNRGLWRPRVKNGFLRCEASGGVRCRARECLLCLLRRFRSSHRERTDFPVHTRDLRLLTKDAIPAGAMLLLHKLVIARSVRFYKEAHGLTQGPWRTTLPGRTLRRKSQP